MNSARCVRCARGEPHQFEHGTQVGGRYHGCTCELCVLAKHRCIKCFLDEPCEYTHGISGYLYHRCRCNVCSRANTESARQYRAAHPGYEAAARHARAAAITPEERAKKSAANKRWHEANPDARRDNDRRKKARWRTLPATRKGPWTPAERRIALRDDISVITIAAMLGRTVISIISMRQAMREGKIATDSCRGARPWTDAEDAVVRRTDLTRKQKAQLTNRTLNAVTHRTKALRKLEDSK